jgi:hypothetical protein
MQNQFRPMSDFTQDLYEIGLIAAASPEFADSLLTALLAAGEPAAAAADPADELQVAAF